MSEATLTFKCVGHTERDDGLIGSYNLEVTDTKSSRTETISVEPNHIASARSMKRILLSQGLLYSTTQKKHSYMLAKMFDTRDDQAAKQSLI